MKAQKYKILGIGSATDDKVSAGQFVHRDNDDSEIRGFVSEVNPYSLDIILFEPDEIPDATNIIIIHETMEPDEVAADLTLLLAANKEILSMWHGVVNNSIKKN